MTHFVYALRTAVTIEPYSNYLKIGHSNDAARRLNDHQISSPLPLTYAVVWRVVQRVTAVRLEAELHRTFKPRNVRGEWFDISIEELVATAQFHLDGKCFSVSTDGSIPSRPRWPEWPPIFRREQMLEVERDHGHG